MEFNYVIFKWHSVAPNTTDSLSQPNAGCFASLMCEDTAEIPGLSPSEGVNVREHWEHPAQVGHSWAMILNMRC